MNRGCPQNLIIAIDLDELPPLLGFPICGSNIDGGVDIFGVRFSPEGVLGLYLDSARSHQGFKRQQDAGQE